jgi:RNA polymerase sigma-70 factor (ECF subfamily)
MNVVRNDAIAKDLWQDTYLKAWRHIQDLKEPSRFKPWLLTIAKRLAFDRRRKDDRERTSSLEEIRSTSDPIDYEADPQVMIESPTDADRIISALAQMEPIHRDILLLHAKGFSRAEIAQKLGYKESTVTTYLSLARKQFRQLYHGMDKTDDSSGKEQKGALAHNASMPTSLDENDHSQESHYSNENRKEN